VSEHKTNKVDRLYESSEWFVTHNKCGESDGPFKTYEEAKAHYEYLCSEGDPDSAKHYFIEEVRCEEEPR